MQRTTKPKALAASLMELVGCGCPVDLSVADAQVEHANIEIEQVGGLCESSIFELDNGLTGYMLDLWITNQGCRRVYCRDLELRLPWEDSWFNWIPDPKEAGESECYSFPGRHPLELPREQVINHILQAPEGLEPKRILRGLLLATGGLMPKNLSHGQQIEATLAIIASNHVESTETISLWTDRLAVKPKRATRKSNLFERLDDNSSQVDARIQRGAVPDSRVRLADQASSAWYAMSPLRGR